MFDEAKINQALENLEREYHSDREALLRIKHMAQRSSLKKTDEPELSTPHKKSASKKKAVTKKAAKKQTSKQQSEKTPTQKAPKKKAKRKRASRKKTKVNNIPRSKSNREIVKQMIVNAGEQFTITELKDLAQKTGDEETASLDSGAWSSALSHLCATKKIKIIEKSVGNIPAVYKQVVSDEELVSPVVRGPRMDSPLQDAVKQAIKDVPTETFDRKALFDSILKNDKKFTDRHKLDSVGAVLNRLASKEDGVRIIERSKTGNTYEKK